MNNNSSFSLFPTAVNDNISSAPSPSNAISTYFDVKYNNQSSLISLYAFGSNEMGQLGQRISLKTLKYSSTPMKITLSSNEIVSSSSLGDGHCVAVSTEGKVYSWGACACGQLGIDDSSNIELDSEGFPIQPFPKLIVSLNGIKIKSVAAGDAHTLALSYNGDIYSWGGSGCGQLGHPNIRQLPKDNENCPYLPYPKLIEAFKDIKMCDIACGKTHSVAIDNSGNVYTWGAGASGQLGVKDLESLPLDDDNYPYQPLPCVLSSLKKNNIYVTKAVCGDLHTLLLSTSGEVYSFGGGVSGQLGLGSVNNLPRDIDHYPFMPIPQKVQGEIQNKQIVYISSGDNHCMVIDNEGRLYGWGCAKYGQLGISLDESDKCERDVEGNTFTILPIHIKKMGNLKAAKVACGENHTLVLTDKGIVFGFGLNHRGQLGIEIDKDNKGGLVNEYDSFISNGEIKQKETSPKMITSLLKYNVNDIGCGGMNNLISVIEERSIHEETFSFFVKELITDFIIECDKCNNDTSTHMIKCHKFILISSSEYFYREIIEKGNDKQMKISANTSYKSIKTILQYLYLKDLSFLSNIENEEICEYMKLSQLFKLCEVEEEIEKKIKSNVKRYLHAIKSINEDKSVKKNNQKFSLKNIFFNSDGTSIVILNENLLREISNQGLQISLSPHQTHQSELNESIDDNNIISEEKDDTISIFAKVPTLLDLISLNIIESDDNANVNGLRYVNNKNTSDITIKIDSHILYTNKIILSSNSSFFANMLTNNMKESKENEITICDFPIKDMFIILIAFYCDNLYFSLDTCLTLLKGFDLFQVRDYLKNKIQIQIENKIDVDNVSKIFEFAHLYNYERLKYVCLCFIRENYDKVIETKSFEELQKEQMLEIMRYWKYKY